MESDRLKENSSRFSLIYRESKTIDELAIVFDQAVPQWMTFFRVDQQQVANFRATGFLIKDKSKFQRANLLTQRFAGIQERLYLRNKNPSGCLINQVNSCADN